jgi:hypothetical protein
MAFRTCVRLVLSIGLISPASPGTAMIVNKFLNHADSHLRLEILDLTVFFEHHRVVASHFGQ